MMRDRKYLVSAEVNKLLATTKGTHHETRDRMHRGGIEELLKVCACQPDVATLMGIKVPDALRKAALDPCP